MRDIYKLHWLLARLSCARFKVDDWQNVMLRILFMFSANSLVMTAIKETAT